MDYLQYSKHCIFNTLLKHSRGFKPYYKWITFNTAKKDGNKFDKLKVLNLIINGLPSIPENLRSIGLANDKF